jgi:hypothetical protein
MNAGLLSYIGLCVSYAFLHVVNFCNLVLLADKVILTLLFYPLVFSEQN